MLDSVAESRDALVTVLRREGYATQGFTTAKEFLQNRAVVQRPCCVLSELSFDEGPSGLELLCQLAASDDPYTLLFCSDSVDVATAVTAMKAGAFSVIKKPTSCEHLLLEVANAVAADDVKHERALRIRQLQVAHDALTERETKILGQLLNGLPNKAIAKSLDVSIRSVENFRARIYHKYGVATPAELAVKATELKLLRQANSVRERPSMS
ncbi:response regulator transcription factor [Botrimarina colliarenosi]|uniref:response regulator transcription factor n=1 Tax=Botrimarina colliarenosi TaxID=2528001 RepID=UPI0018D3B4C6|nr:LuxR C-terminal-related transcriptional regulator [Botrimarina colliarenosi]